MRKSLALSMAWIFLLPLLGLAQTEGYDSRSYARLSFVSGEVHVQRPGDMGYVAGTANLALIEGDKLGTQDGRAEVSFGRLNCLRLDRLSQVEFINLPRDAVEPFKLHLFSGSLYLRVSRLESDKEFEVHTPDASFYVLAEGLYRVDVLQNKETRFSAVEGEAEVAGEEGSFTLRAGQSLTASNGQTQTGLTSLYAENDDFGRWNQSRDSLMARNTTGSSYLPEELYEYDSELNEYGDWRYEADYGNVWVPRTRNYDDWRPYYYGRWVWYPIIGWTWVSDEPWGWSVYHYGRWHWGVNLGWYWIPTRHWGPAWVHWYSDDRHVGWCALNWWNRPTVVINNHFYHDYSQNNYSVNNRAMVVVSRNQLQAPRMSSVALRGEALNRIGRVTLAARQPGIPAAADRSGRLQGEAARTFALSRGRNVERSFGRQNTVRGVTLRSRDEQGAFRSSRGTSVTRGARVDSSRPRSFSGREGTTLRTTEGRAIRGDQSGAARGGNTSANTSRGIKSYEPNSGRSSSSARITSRTSDRSSSLRQYDSRSSSRGTNSRRTLSSRTSPDPSFPAGRSTSSGSRSALPRTYSSRSSSPGRSSRSSGLLNPGGSNGNQPSWSRSGSSSSSSGSSRKSSYRSYNSSPRSSSSPSYSRPSYSFSSPRSSSSSGRTYSSPSRSSSRSISPRSSGSNSQRSYSSPSRSSGSASRSSSSSGHRSSSSSRSSRSNRRR